MTSHAAARAMHTVVACGMAVAALIPCVGAAQPATPAQPPVPKPSFINLVKSNEYPPDALRKGISGKVWFTVIVGVDGKVVDCRVTRSSGAIDLDNATCAAVMLRARFNPATDASGMRVQAEFASTLRWTIPR